MCRRIKISDSDHTATWIEIRYWIATLFLTLLTVTSAHAQPTVWGSVTPNIVEADTQTITLSWGSSGADYCEADGAMFPTSGSMTGGPFPAGNYSQAFSCSNSAGTTHYTLYWTAEPPAPPTPVLHSFELTPAVVQITDPILLSWSSSHADSCPASTGDIYAANGSMTIPAGTLPVGYHTFSMYCEGAGGTSNTITTSITVEAPPPQPVLHTFEFGVSTIYANESVSVSWSSSHADLCSIPTVGDFAASGTEVYPAGTFSAGVFTFTMSCTGPGGTSNPITATLTVLEPLPSLPSTPSGLISTNTTLFTGDAYTISWNAVTGATDYELSQNGTPINVSGTSDTFSQSNAGTYSYQVSACNAAGCSAPSAAISVVVNDPPLPDPVFLIGFDGEYSGFWPVSSSSGDLYVMRNNTDGNYEGVTHFILVEQPGGTYTLNANPTSAQISQFNLNTPAAIAYELADINLDGAMDMVLLDSGNIASGIVYAATSSQSAPIGYKHIDEEFVEFFADLYQGILDPDYFYRTAFENNWGTWEYGQYLQRMYYNTAMLHQSGQLFRQDSDFGPQGPGMPFYSDISEAYVEFPVPLWCQLNFGLHEFVHGSWWVYGWYYPAVFTPDYSSFSQDAMLLSNAFKSYYETETESTSVQSVIYQVLGEYIGAVFGGYAHNESTARATVFRIWRLLGPVIYQEPEPPLFRTRLDIVYTAVPIAGASHAWLLATDSTGAQYATRGGPEGWISVTKPFGHIEAWALPPLDPNFPDNPTLNQATFIQEVGFISIDIHNVIPSYSVANILNSFRDRTNNAEIVYNPFVRNSNSYAFQAVEELGQLRPTPLLWAPGWSTVLSVP